ncbi:Benzaldehyde dehydrogenase [NAD(+)] [Oligella ureolytica]|uniref:Salicylaldehyde dehydrogenase n=1 Tax=Oligella ureolytica TaxID=90244 RepID=A0A378XHS9_9BURK|nr:aldehyde dehydrogenase [Oligella ureolytica]QPT39202.1 aldehyde dehydrogenase [Oligella ureolytica]SUA55234.1 Benzaldehyde dehydrogenase [NAD(+)] [Oligella ureolytica]
MNTVKLLIDGQMRDATGQKTFTRINPITGEVASVAAAAQSADVQAALESAEKAFQTWSKLGPTERRMRLLKAADIMDQRAEEFVLTARQETGSTNSWYGFNVHLSANILREAAAMTTQIDGSIIPTDLPGSISMGVRTPCGVVLSIAPWNAPVILATRAIAMPLACGNTVILKASEMCPATHTLIGEVLNDAGIGPGVVNVITNAPEDAGPVVEQLIAHPAVKRINFTGSTKVGKIIATTSAKYLKPALLELGGKAPVIVCEDADLEQAVAGVAFGAFFNQGQICMSTERLIVSNKIADQFLEKLVAKIKTIKVGSPDLEDTTFAYLESAQSVQRIRELVEDAVSKGATLPVPMTTDGALMHPLIINGITPEMKLYAQESFGPVVTMTTFETVEEAIRLANDSDYGLSSAVFTQNINTGIEIAKQIDSGLCHINGPTVHDEAQAPFGGTKDSGYGRFGSKSAINEFTELRWVTLQTTPRQYPI